MSTLTGTSLDDVREAFGIASAGNWRDYESYVNRILDDALALMHGDAA